MGITGLLPTLQSITSQRHLSQYSGLLAGVDAMGWLHRSVHSSTAAESISLAFAQHAPDDPRAPPPSTSDRPPTYLSKTLSRCALLSSHGLIPLLVIDGASLPGKKHTDKQRKKERRKAFDIALAMKEQQPPPPAGQLHKLFARSLSVTHEMRQELICELHSKGIQFMVAPYEADAQLAFLSRTCLIDVVVTEDGDSLAYGCPRVLLKLDHTGACEELLHGDLGRNQPLSFKSWTHDMFVCMCILAGCDYCPKIKGLGITNAHKIVRRERKPNRIISALIARYPPPAVPPDFPQRFARAFLTFQHQRIFNPDSGCVEMLHRPNFGSWYWLTARGNSPLPPTVGETDFLGREMSDELGARVSMGLVHPQLCVSWARLSEQPIEPEAPAIAAIAVDLGMDFDKADEPSPVVKGAPVPVHFAQYRSKLLGSGFETLSRRQKRLGGAKGLDVRLKSRPSHQWVPKKDETTPWAGENGQQIRPTSRPDTMSTQRETPQPPRGRSKTKRRKKGEKVAAPPPGAVIRADIREPKTMSAAAAIRVKAISVDRSRSASRSRSRNRIGCHMETKTAHLSLLEPAQRVVAPPLQLGLAMFQHIRIQQVERVGREDAFDW